MKPSILQLLSLMTLATISLQSCGIMGDNFNLFPVSKDVKLGKQTASQIPSDPSEKIIPHFKALEAYRLLDDIVRDIKTLGKLKNKENFAWEVHIIDADIPDAFCTHGGYIYVYAGLMKYLDTTDDLAGIMGHEMAHADERHSTKQMTEQYGTEIVSELILGDMNNSQIAQLGKSLINLKYARSDESQADTRSVEYLCKSRFKADGTASFFEKLTKKGQSQSALEGFFSTHPSPSNRVVNIKEHSKALNCNTKPASGINKKIVSRL